VYVKNNYFVATGKINLHLGFIEKRYFHTLFNPDGDENANYIVGQGGFVASLVRFLLPIPAIAKN
jgi:hypothetical protein